MEGPEEERQRGGCPVCAGLGSRVRGSHEAGEVTEGLQHPREDGGALSSLLNEEGRHVPSD